MPKKYELTDETIEHDGRTLHRIKALIDILFTVKAGDLGGWVESEENLSHNDYCWVYDNAKVYGDAVVFGNAEVSDNAEVCDDAMVYGDAKVYGNADVCGDAWVFDNAEVCENAEVYDNAWVFDNAVVYENAKVFDHAWIRGDAEVCSNAKVYGYTKVCDGEVRKTSDLITVGPIGSRAAYTTFNRYSCTVCTGFFNGTIDEFETAVNETHGDNEYGKDYAIIIAMFKAVCDNARE